MKDVICELQAESRSTGNWHHM